MLAELANKFRAWQWSRAVTGALRERPGDLDLRRRVREILAEEHERIVAASPAGYVDRFTPWVLAEIERIEREHDAADRSLS